MAETLGEKLRAAREARGVSISEVAEQTRIAPMYIECIENDNYKPLPGGIFNKGFVKSYARFIGYDEQDALQEYGRIASQSEPAKEEQFRTYRPEVLTDDNASQITPSTIVFAGIFLFLLIGAVYLITTYLTGPASGPSVVTNSSPNANSAASNVVDGAPAEPPTPSGAPTMQNARIEFRTSGEPIWLSATSDGMTSVTTVTAATPQTFDPRESLRLSYSKSLSSSAQLFINGKQIKLPSEPANPRRAAIEMEINAANLGQVWESGQFTFAAAETASTPAPAAQSAPSTPRPAANTNTARANTAANTAANTRPRTTPTPIVAGNAARTRPRPTPN